MNDANLILPAGDVKIGPSITISTPTARSTTSTTSTAAAQDGGQCARCWWRTWARREDASQIQYNIVRVDGQPSVYLPVLKQGGDANTIAVVDGIKDAVAHLLDVPEAIGHQGRVRPVRFRRNAIENLIHEGVIGLVLTGLMILIFLGSMRATVAVFLVHSAFGAGGVHRAGRSATAPSMR